MNVSYLLITAAEGGEINNSTKRLTATVGGGRQQTVGRQWAEGGRRWLKRQKIFLIIFVFCNPGYGFSKSVNQEGTC